MQPRGWWFHWFRRLSCPLWWCQQNAGTKRTIDCCDNALCVCVCAYPFPSFLVSCSCSPANFIQFHERSINAAQCAAEPSSHSQSHSHCDSDCRSRIFLTSIPRRRRLAACTCSAGHLLDSWRAFICFYICPRFQLNASALGSPSIVRALRSHGEPAFNFICFCTKKEKRNRVLKWIGSCRENSLNSSGLNGLKMISFWGVTSLMFY